MERQTATLIKERDNGLRVLDFLSCRFTYFDRTTWQNEIDSGRLQLDESNISGAGNPCCRSASYLEDTGPYYQGNNFNVLRILLLRSEMSRRGSLQILNSSFTIHPLTIKNYVLVCI